MQEQEDAGDHQRRGKKKSPNRAQKKSKRKNKRKKGGVKKGLVPRDAAEEIVDHAQNGRYAMSTTAPAPVAKAADTKAL